MKLMYALFLRYTIVHMYMYIAHSVPAQSASETKSIGHKEYRTQNVSDSKSIGHKDYRTHKYRVSDTKVSRTKSSGNKECQRFFSKLGDFCVVCVNRRFFLIFLPGIIYLARNWQHWVRAHITA
jgi:hypothetical protein